MTVSSSPNRHLSRAGLDNYLALAAPATVVVPGSPRVRITIDPLSKALLLITPYRNDPLDLVEFENVTARVISTSDGNWHELLVRYQGQPHEAYLLLCDIADMVQLASIPFPAAARSALDTFSELLTKSRSLTVEKQIGLYGELLLLECMFKQLTPTSAVAAWKGYTPSEHDFILGRNSVEVKTTRSEHRRHRIGSLEQLQPTPGLTLWVVSIQLTSATPAVGRTLGELVEDVRKMSGSARSAVDAGLHRTGWRERDRERYVDHLVLRSTPTAYKVEDSFPALTRAIVDRACANSGLIEDASYTIDLTSLSPAEPPAPVELFVKGAPRTWR